MRLWSSRPAPLLGRTLGEPFSAPAPRVVWGVQGLLLAAGETLAARFGALVVRGEVSGFTRAASGHCYFTLKDADGSPAVVRCAMFRRAAQYLEFDPNLNDGNGQQVEIRGRLAVYEPRGELQLVVEAMRRLGTGNLYEEFLRLKSQLEALGLFAPERKRPVSREPRVLGIVTSLAGAALHDVLTTLARRAAHVRVVVYPSLVQGPEAPLALVDALAEANRRAEVDTLLLVRGGGALEDLWAFNDPRVVRAVAASDIPIVCGVGHETDVTLSDLAADLRAPTPTAAAELAAPSRDERLQALAADARRLRQAVQGRLAVQAHRIDRLALRLAAPAAAVAAQHQRLAGLRERLVRAAAQRLTRESERLTHRAAALAALDPAQVLQRGYAWVEDAAGRPVVSVHALAPGQSVEAVWADGRASARIESLQPSP